MDTIPRRDLRVARLDRRGATRGLVWWIVVADGLSAAADGHPGPRYFAHRAVLIAATALPVAAIFRWRIRGDGEGLHRRVLPGWDRGPWSAFESG